MVTTAYHEPVLLAETLGQLNLAPGALIVDGTLGGGGHAAAILEQTAPDGRLIGLDLDRDAIREAGTRLEPFGERVQLIQASFRRLDDIADELGPNAIDGIVLDLGVSSHQLDVSRRGFRFAGDESESTPLDMRMDPHSDRPSAADLLARASAEELQGWFQRYGELPGSRRLAHRITEERSARPLRTTADLLRVIDAAGIGRGRKHNPATLVFQALRIAVNDELGALEEGLEAAVDVLRPSGRLVVISYHSLEDRIVKQHLRTEARGCICPREVPICICNHQPRLRIITRRPLRPGQPETESNPRARSGLLRSAERIEEAA